MMRCPVLDCVYNGTLEEVRSHLDNAHPQIGRSAANYISIFPFVEIRAFKGYVRTYRHRFPVSLRSADSPGGYLNEYKRPIKSIISTNTLGSSVAIKAQVTVEGEFIRGEVETPRHESCTHYINSKARIINNISTFDEFYSFIVSDIEGIVDIFEYHGSGWKFHKVLGCDIRIAKYKPRRGRCFIKLTQSLSKKGALINVQNEERECFKWAFLSVAHYEDVRHHRNKVSTYKRFVNKYNWKGIMFPSTIEDIMEFEKQNSKHKIAINILECSSSSLQINVIRISPKVFLEGYKPCDVLLYTDTETKMSHYVGIANISKLFGKKNFHKKSFCYNCQNLYGKKIFNEHVVACRNFKTQRIKIPKVKDGVIPVIRFKDYFKELPHDYVLFCDFECIMTEPTRVRVSESTKNISKHTPSGFALFLIGKAEGIADYICYRGKDCIKKFFEKIDFLCNTIRCSQKYEENMNLLSNDEWEQYEDAKVCHICKFPFTPHEIKTRDHDHKSGAYRGPAHVSCNLGFSLKRRRTPCFIHNLSKYDMHLIIGRFRHYQGDIKVIPSNFERYISIITNKYTLLDSFMFVSSSLDKLVSRLNENEEKFKQNFKLLIQFFGINDARFLCRKGVYFYDYIRNFSQFEETTFPEKKHFFNVLHQEHISDDDYLYACKVYDRYCKTLGDYHDLYNKVDTILQADVMQNFRNLAIKFYEIDPAHYFTLSSFTWDAALKMTRVRLDKLTNINMYQMFECGLRGGVSVISHRYARANNKYFKDFDPSKPSSFILSVDCNNLYGTSLRSFLPISHFKFLKSREIKRITEADILNWEDEAPVGYVLCVDLTYPSSLHRRDSDYPLAPDLLSLKNKQLSPFQLFLLDVLGLKYNENTQKLIPHLGNRKRYVVHYRTLKLYLSKGMRLKKIRKVISFHQGPWLREYIDFNTEQRKQAEDDFAKDLFKFLINACFGKSCENMRKRTVIKICNDLESAKRLINDHNFRRFQIINSQVIIVEMCQKSVELNKAIYTGFTCLEIAKLIMFDFHMNVIKKKYPNSSTLLQTDTDNLNYFIETEDIYKDLESIKTHFDFSEYPKNHFLFSEENKKALGKFKDEASSKPILEFCGLAPKLYSFIGEGIWKKAAKGVKRSVIDRTVMHSVFKNVLMKHKRVKTKINLIKSNKHVIHTIQLNKSSLHPFDGKRWIMNDGVTTLPHFHFLIKRHQVK